MRIFTVFLLVLSLAQFKAQCSAGDDVTVFLCENGETEQLFNRITGGPVAVGDWFDPSDVPFDGTLDPAVAVDGVYYYVVSQSSAGVPCVPPDTAFLTVNVTDIPQVTFNLDNNTSCASLTSEFTNTTLAPGFTSCSWNFGDGDISTVCNPTHTYADTGCYSVSLTLMNGIGCVATDTLFDVACVEEAPTAFFRLEENPILTTNPRAVFINESVSATGFEWIIPSVGNFNNEELSVILPPLEETYFVCLEASADNGCQDTYCSNLLVRDEVLIYVPNAFTPNLDRVNEQFKPSLTFNPERYEFTIYDRWGNTVFTTDNPQEGWIGDDDRNQYLVADSYYSYKIRATKNAEIIEKLGQVLVIR